MEGELFGGEELLSNDSNFKLFRSRKKKTII